MTRVLVITGGPDYAHDFSGPAGTGTALARLLADEGHEVRCTDDVDAGFLDSSQFDVVVINALRWRMLAERYEPWRDPWAFSPSAEARRALIEFVSRGGALIACHTAVICFDDWPEWGAVLGGRWVWDVSSHPSPDDVQVSLVDAAHPLVEGIERWNLVDEVYGDLDMSTDVTVVATARRHDNDRDQPVIWTHQVGKGRVVVNTFGHDAASLQGDEHRRWLSNALRWCTPACEGVE